MRKLILSIIMLLLLSGCVANETRIENYTAENEAEAEELFASDDRLKAVSALFHEDQLLVGIRVKTFSRFTKRKIAKELKKELEAYYPDMKVFVSADSKVLMETTKLLTDVEGKKLSKKVKDLISLAEEET